MLSGLSRDLEDEATAAASLFRASLAPEDDPAIIKHLDRMVARLFHTESHVAQLCKRIEALQANLKASTGRLAKKAFDDVDVSDYEEDIVAVAEDKEPAQEGQKLPNVENVAGATTDDGTMQEKIKVEVKFSLRTSSLEKKQKQQKQTSRGRTRSNPICLLSDDEEGSSQPNAPLDPIPNPDNLAGKKETFSRTEVSGAATAPRSQTAETGLAQKTSAGATSGDTCTSPALDAIKEKKRFTSSVSTAQTRNYNVKVKAEQLEGPFEPSSLKRKRLSSPTNAEERPSKVAVKDEPAESQHPTAGVVASDRKQSSLIAGRSAFNTPRVKKENVDAATQSKQTLPRVTPRIKQEEESNHDRSCSSVKPPRAVTDHAGTSANTITPACKQEETQE